MSRTALWTSGLGVCVGLFVLVYLLSVHTASGQLVDTMMLTTAQGTSHPLPPLRSDDHWIPVWILGPPAVTTAGITLARWRSNMSLLVPLVAAGTVAASNLTTQLFKAALPHRPELATFDMEWHTNSLPSGHTTMAASASVALFLAAEPKHRPLLGVLGAVWAALWGGYIYVEGWHLPSDMMAAYLVVAAWGLIGGWLVLRRETREHHRVAASPGERLRGRREAGLCATVGIIGTGAGLLFLFGPAAQSGIEDAVESPTPSLWLAGAAFSAAPAFLTAAAGLALFAREVTPPGR